MLKKTIALLLALALTLAAGAALADEGFLLMFSVLYSEDVLGQPVYYSPVEGNEDPTCTIFFDFPAGQTVLRGEDDQNETYLVAWTAEPGAMIALMHSICASYGSVSQHCGHGLRIAWKLAEGDAFTALDNEQDAMTYAAILESVMQSTLGSAEAGAETSEADAGTAEAGAQ